MPRTARAGRLQDVYPAGGRRAPGWAIVDDHRAEGLARRLDLDTVAAGLAAGGAAGLLFAQQPDADGFLPKRLLGGPPLPLPALTLRGELLPALDGRLVSATVPLRRGTAAGANVLGRLASQPTGPTPAPAPLLLSAHYDGVGDDPGTRLPGAGDNASGVAVVLEAARLLSQDLARDVAGPPARARPLVVALCDAEEVGALGSAAHAAALEHQGIQPLTINLDMAGRRHEVAAVEASSTAGRLVDALDQAGRWLGIALAGAPVASDNHRYATCGPSVGLGFGTAGYHSPADTADRVEDAALLAAARLLLATAWQLTDRASATTPTSTKRGTPQR